AVVDAPGRPLRRRGRVPWLAAGAGPGRGAAPGPGSGRTGGGGGPDQRRARYPPGLGAGDATLVATPADRRPARRARGRAPRLRRQLTRSPRDRLPTPRPRRPQIPVPARGPRSAGRRRRRV